VLIEYRGEVESPGLVSLLKQLSPSMSLESSAQRRGIFSAHPLVFGGGGSATVAWNSFQDDTLARSEQRALGSFNREWARGNSTVQPRTAAVLVFDSRDDAYLAQARMLSQQREAKRAAFLHATQGKDLPEEPQLHPSPSDGFHSLLTRMRLQGSLTDPANSLDDDDGSAVGGQAESTQDLRRCLYKWKSVFWFLDRATNLVPSMVHSSTDLYRAVKGEGWLFDAIVVTDVDSARVADALCRELVPLLNAWENVMRAHARRVTSAFSRGFGGGDAAV